MFELTLRRPIAFAYVLTLLTLVFISPAAATTGGFALPSATTIAAGIGLLIPLLVSAVTHAQAPAWLKSLANLVLAAVVSALAVFTDSGVSHTWRAFLGALVAALVTSATSYLTVSGPLGVTTLIERLIPGGLGRPTVITSPLAGDPIIASGQPVGSSMGQAVPSVNGGQGTPPSVPPAS